MNCVWEHPGINGPELNSLLEKAGYKFGHNMYSYLSSCVKKGVLRKEMPFSQCFPIVSREEVTNLSLNQLVKKMFGDSPSALVASLVSDKNISAEELDKIKKIVEEIDTDERQ